VCSYVKLDTYARARALRGKRGDVIKLAVGRWRWVVLFAKRLATSVWTAATHDSTMRL
jgi:hypothetical protein